MWRFSNTGSSQRRATDAANSRSRSRRTVDGHGHDHSHGHGHDHDHTPIQAEEPAGYYHNLADAARELLIEKGYFDGADVREMIERIDSRTPAIGASIVAKAWSDPAFKERLLTNGKKTLKEEMDIDVVVADLVVVENTEDVHNVVVCTLCSCYPVFVLGRPPDWYKSREYRSRVVRHPRQVPARVRHRDRRRPRGPRPRLHRRHALPGAAQAPRRHRRLERGTTRRHRRPRLDDRRRGSGAAELGRACIPPFDRPASPATQHEVALPTKALTLSSRAPQAAER